MRSAGRIEPGSAIESISEVIGASAITGASLHIVHINSTCPRDAMECLSMVEGARARGLDVTTEAYPYIAGMTTINSALFNPGWREKFGIEYGELCSLKPASISPKNVSTNCMVPPSRIPCSSSRTRKRWWTK